MESTATDSARDPLPALLATGFYGFWMAGLPMFCAPFVAAEFGLGDDQVAWVSGIASIGTFGTYALTRWADRRGRRPALRIALAASPLLALLAGLAPSVAAYVAALIGFAALHGTLVVVTPVAITEVADDRARAGGQAWFGIISSFGGAIPLGMVAALGEQPDGWRLAFAAAALGLLALPWLWQRVPETGRFERSRDRGHTSSARVLDLLTPRYRRRAIGITVVAMLRGAALTAIGFYAFHHGVNNLQLAPWVVAAVFVAGGVLGMSGSPLGAWGCERYGRRPTLVAGLAIHVVAGTAWYFVPSGELWPTALGLAVCFFGFNLGIQAFGVADRLIDTELFPTPLRASFAGLRMITSAAAALLGNIALALLIGWSGSLSNAVLVMAAALVPISIVLLFTVVPETRGLTLEQAALEPE